MIFTNSRPRPGERLQTLAARACPGEYEPLTFALHALRDLPEVNVAVTDLRSAAADAPLAADRFELRVAQSAFRRITHYAGPGEFMFMPTWLAVQSSLHIPAGRSRWFWITVHVPDDAKPGRYEGRLAITVGGQPRAQFGLVLDVLPIRLTEPAGYAIGFYDLSPAERFWPDSAQTN